MSFNYLPDNVVIQILTQLDDWSKMRAMNVFERWAEIFGSTSQLINEFELEIDRYFAYIWKLEDLPNIAINNVSISGIYRENPRKLTLPILKKYENSIKTIAIKHSELSAYHLAEILGFKNLEQLKLINIEIRSIGFYEKCHLTTPTIKSLEIEADHKEVNKTLDLFNHCASIEKLSLRYRKKFENEPDLNCFFLFDMIKTLPNLKHFVFWNKEIEPLDTMLTEDFPAKLKKLEIFYFSYDTKKDIEFFRNQKDTMKELIVHENLKRVKYHSEILTIIFTEMNLKYFQFGKLDMIVNYERQPESFLPFLKKPKYE